VIAAIWVLEPIGAKALMMYGFIITAICFAGLAICFEIEPDEGRGNHTNHTNHTNPTAGFGKPESGGSLKWTKFALFCVVNCALNFGPNIATYVLPAVIYPYEVRSTFHGLSAGMGKVGAVIGTFLYPQISNAFGVAAVLWVQVGFSLVGALVAMLFLD
jgi:nitrate/nitrite transporter NarK